jgi:hypothetical protein
MICHATGLSLGLCNKFPLRSGVYLDLSLLLVREDQAAWLIKNRPASQTAMPNFMDSLDPGPLMQVNQKAVQLALPEQAPPR